MDAWVALAAAIVGGSGIVGLLTAGAQATQSARLKRSIDNLTAARKSLEPGPVRDRVQRALEMDALRLSNLSIKSKLTSIVWYILSVVLMVAGIALIYAGVSGFKFSPALMPLISGVLIGWAGLMTVPIYIRDVRRAHSNRRLLKKMGLPEEELSD